MSDSLSLEDLDRVLTAQKGRLIHQIWFGLIPNKREAKKAYGKMKVYRDSWKIQNPTWFHIEWNKPMCVQFVKTFYPEHIDLFKNYRYEIQRCDAVRYLLLHRYGGWYADMDYFCNRPLDEAMVEYKNDIYFVQTPNTTIFHESADHISNSLMYSVPGHTFWKQIMLELEKKQKFPSFYGQHVTVMYTTGPSIINRVYSQYKYRYGVRSLPWKFFHPFGIGDNKCSLTSDPNVFTVHVGKGSWEQNDSKFFLILYTEWSILLFILSVLGVAMFICSYSRNAYLSQ